MKVSKDTRYSGLTHCVSRMIHKTICGSKISKYESQSDLWLIRDSQFYDGFSVNEV